MMEKIYEDSNFPWPEILKVDGGAAANEVFMQILADVLGMRVEVMNPLQATAYGAALMAGESCGIWEPNSSVKLRRIYKAFQSKWSEDECDHHYTGRRETFRGQKARNVYSMLKEFLSRGDEDLECEWD